MGRNKSSGLKIHLHKERKKNYPVPSWVVMRTKRRVRTNPQKRMWRRRKLKTV